jgi:hypothetical protein
MHVTNIERPHMDPIKLRLHNQTKNDKDKTIWWEHVNAGQSMIKNDFI